MSDQITTTRISSARFAPVLFTMTIFLSAALLFFVQPLFTKITLPFVGGAPAVWTTAMLFFQTVLILGYVYAHLSTRYLPVVVQIGLHLMLWAIALVFLPLSVEAGWRFDPAAPVALQTLVLFAVGVGMPFAVLSANAPLIQSWYAKSGGPSADDPYFLYAASNFGSLVALLAFPLAAEPLLGARQIGIGWAGGFVILGGFLALSGQMARKGSVQAARSAPVAGPSLRQYGWWLLLAFVPSSLMLAVTSKISTDLGSFPLVWVLPLSLYLLTFVVTFTNRPRWNTRIVDLLFLISLAFFVSVYGVRDLSGVTIALTVLLLVAFYNIALKAHRMLYEARPDHGNLTLFYVTMSVGGALGGVFNSLLAPFIFTDLHEGRVTIFVALLLLLAGTRHVTTRVVSWALIAAVVVLLPMLALNAFPSHFGSIFAPLHIVVLGAVLFALRRNRVQQFIVLVTLLGLGFLLQPRAVVFKDRSFFGSHLVQDFDNVRIYMNGTTIHGAQRLSETDMDSRPTPLFYYHPDGPMAQIMTSPAGVAAERVGIVGLGVGALACYAQPGQAWEFYEIDVMVDRVARDPALFTFMSRCAGTAPTHFGDARMVLEQQDDRLFDILVIDAYSSDAVPVHLTTSEAIALYRDRTTEDGVIVLHISNRYFDLARPLGRSAAALGLTAMIRKYAGDPDDATNSASHVVIIGRNADHLAGFTAGVKWDALVDDGGRIWTDDYANLLTILR